MRTKITLISILLSFVFISFAQIPPNYYDNAVGKRGVQMQAALHNIIKGHTVVSYSSLHTYYQVTDKKPNGKVWDMYSDIPGGTPPYEFTFITDKCGSYQHEGDCYNREHSFPQSWFNKASPMKSDLFHVYPTDGKVNGWRSSYPYGEVDNPTITTQNGSKLGPNTTAGYSGTVFEPIDAYKGDFARTYFYMATRYYTEDNGWKNNAAVNGSQMKPWELHTLYQWNLQDTVSQKEIDRNNAVYGIQHNRNPFIDHPEWIDSIWFDDTSIDWLVQNTLVSLFPNPAISSIEIKISTNTDNSWEVSIFDMQGHLVFNNSFNGNSTKIDISKLNNGLYFLQLKNNDNTIIKNIKWIKQ